MHQRGALCIRWYLHYRVMPKSDTPKSDAWRICLLGPTRAIPKRDALFECGPGSPFQIIWVGVVLATCLFDPHPWPLCWSVVAVVAPRNDIFFNFGMHKPTQVMMPVRHVFFWVAPGFCIWRVDVAGGWKGKVKIKHNDGHICSDCSRSHACCCTQSQIWSLPRAIAYNDVPVGHGFVAVSPSKKTSRQQRLPKSDPLTALVPWGLAASPQSRPRDARR